MIDTNYLRFSYLTQNVRVFIDPIVEFHKNCIESPHHSLNPFQAEETFYLHEQDHHLRYGVGCIPPRMA